MRYFILLIFVSGIALSQSKDSIIITYIANEGFLISGKTNKIMIDGIFTEGWGKYHIPTTEALMQEREASSPFNDITLLFVSHNHADHLNPGYLTEHMVGDDKSVLICPSQVDDLLKPMNEYNAIKNRINIITPEFNSKIDTTIHNIKLKIISIHHADDNSNEIQNLGFIFDIDGFKIFHPGDAISNDLNVYQNMFISDDSIDIAFLPRWFFDTEYGDKGIDIIKYIKPKAIIIMHVNTDKYIYYKNAVKNINGIPPVLFMETPMEILNVTDTLFVTSVKAERKENSVPCKLDLNQNYPNPFNPATVISYRSPASSNVRLTIYNLLGQKIKILANSFQSAGEHSIVWDATNDKSNPVSSGVYFYKLEANQQTLQKKMLLIR